MKIAIVESGWFDPSGSAGGRAIQDLQHSLTRIGFKSKIFIDSDSIRDEIHQFKARAIVVSRPTTMARAQDFRSLFGVPIIYWAQDLHSRRESLFEKLNGCPAHTSLVTAFTEKLAISAADIAVFPTRNEAIAAARKFSLNSIDQHPYFSFSDGELENKTSRSKNIVFIGSKGHAPNEDGLIWFLKEVWPSVHNKVREARLLVIGDWKGSQVLGEVKPGVEFTGQISEASVNRIMRESLVGIAPLRFGAGIKRKTLQYLHAGLVTVATDFGLEGLPRNLDNTAWYRANGQEEFTNVICKILGEDFETENTSHAGREFILRRFSKERFDTALLEILAKVGL